MSASRCRRALFGAVAVVLVTVASLAAVEVALRGIDYPPAAFSPWIRSADFGFRLAPNIAMRMRGPEYDVEIATNSLGMRDEEPRPKAGRPIVLLHLTTSPMRAIGHSVARSFVGRRSER